MQPLTWADWVARVLLWLLVAAMLGLSAAAILRALGVRVTSRPGAKRR